MQEVVKLNAFSTLPSHKVAFSVTLSGTEPSSSPQLVADRGASPDKPLSSSWALSLLVAKGVVPCRIKKKKTPAQSALLCPLQEDDTSRLCYCLSG